MSDLMRRFPGSHVLALQASFFLNDKIAIFIVLFWKHDFYTLASKRFNRCSLETLSPKLMSIRASAGEVLGHIGRE
jgi:hypothetical protein